MGVAGAEEFEEAYVGDIGLTALSGPDALPRLDAAELPSDDVVSACRLCAGRRGRPALRAEEA